MSDQLQSLSASHGWICYLEIPTNNADSSSAFYHAVFGWRIRRDDSGNISFDDGHAGTREVSGMWVTGRPPLAKAGIIISIMVDNAAKTVEEIVKHGGKIVEPLNPTSQEQIARFLDPSGSLLGIYQGSVD